MWTCTNCGTTHESKQEVCDHCGSWRSIRWRGPKHDDVKCPARRTRGQLVTAQELAKADLVSLPLSPNWRVFLGSLAPQFAMLTYSPPGHGKSTYLLLLAVELALHGEVLFVAAEEGQSNTMIEKLNRLEIHSQKIRISSAVSLPELIEDLDKASGTRFLIIDSLQAFPITLIQLSEIVESRRLGVAFSAHASKDHVTYKGGSEWGHWVDVVVRADQGKLLVEKNRYGPLAQGQLTWNSVPQEVNL